MFRCIKDDEDLGIRKGKEGCVSLRDSVKRRGIASDQYQEQNEERATEQV